MCDLDGDALDDETPPGWHRCASCAEPFTWGVPDLLAEDPYLCRACRAADERYADVLARAAALPPFDTTGAGLDGAVDATIRLVVENSPVRLTFPPDFDPGSLSDA